MRLLFSALTALALCSTPVVAEDAPLSFGAAQPTTTNGLWFTALFGVQVGPAYFGADETTSNAAFSPSPVYLSFRNLSFGEQRFKDDPRARKDGFGLRGSFRFISARDADDYDDLDGLDDVDATLEVGAGVIYTTANAEAFADIRYGIGGSDGWVGELGADIISRPTDRLAFRLGPRLLFGSDNYADTYFGVTESESASSGLDAYDPDSGLISSGIEFTATYRLGDRWWLEGGATFERFQGDAADSPIVREGSDENASVHIGLRRAFVLEF